MADAKTNREKQGGQALAPQHRERQGLQRWEPFGGFGGPFEWMDRMNDEMERMFDRIARDFGSPRRSWLSRVGFGSPSRQELWSPRIEAFQEGDHFIVRAELPALKKDDVHVELTDDALTIRGERREEHQEQREGFYHSERQYGQFLRTIPLPEGVIGESAEANFKDGLLEIRMQAAPSEANRGRRLEIKDGSAEPNK